MPLSTHGTLRQSTYQVVVLHFLAPWGTNGFRLWSLRRVWQPSACSTPSSTRLTAGGPTANATPPTALLRINVSRDHPRWYVPSVVPKHFDRNNGLQKPWVRSSAHPSVVPHSGLLGSPVMNGIPRVRAVPLGIAILHVPAPPLECTSIKRARRRTLPYHEPVPLSGMRPCTKLRDSSSCFSSLRGRRVDTSSFILKGRKSRIWKIELLRKPFGTRSRSFLIHWATQAL